MSETCRLVFIQIKEHNIYECLSDPKNMSGVDERYSEFSNKISYPHLRKPVKFVYTNGMVQRVFALPDDPDWSVNMKKGILNMLQVDITGKDTETGLKDMYTKEEVSYSIRALESLQKFGTKFVKCYYPILSTELIEVNFV